MSSRILAVALRDFKHTVLTKAFIIGAIALPILLGATIPLIAFFMDTEPPPLSGSVVVVDPVGDLAAAVQTQFDEVKTMAGRVKALQESAGAAEAPSMNPADLEATGRQFGEAVATSSEFMSGRIELTVLPEPTGDVEALKGRIRSENILAAVIVPAALLAPPNPDAAASEAERDDAVDDGSPAATRFELLIPEGMDPKHSSIIERRVGRAIVRVRLARDGQDVEATLAMSQAPKSNTLKMLEGGGERVESEGTRIAQQMLPMACMFLLWIAVFSSANWLLMSTIEEKSNKVIEVLLSAVSPMQLMSGKILGQCAVGLIMFGMYAGIGLAALVVFALFDLIAPITLVLVLIYFLMAYFMIASMFAGIGSAVSDLREANTLMTPAMLILMVPMMLWMPISNDPNGMLATVTSFIPPVLPFVMVLRVTAPEPVPIWQIALSLLWGGAATIGFVWMSARIFRIGVLMQGKPPSPMELLKWIRYS